MGLQDRVADMLPLSFNACCWHTEHAPTQTCSGLHGSRCSPRPALPCDQPQMAQDDHISYIRSLWPVGGVAGCGFP